MKSLCCSPSVLNPVIVFTLICIKEREKGKGKKKSCCRSFILFLFFLLLLRFWGTNRLFSKWLWTFLLTLVLQFFTQWVLNSQPTIHLELTRGRVANWARAHWHFFFPLQNHKICLSLLQGLEVVQAGTYCCPSRMYRKWSSHYCSFWAYRWTSW